MLTKGTQQDSLLSSIDEIQFHETLTSGDSSLIVVDRGETVHFLVSVLPTERVSVFFICSPTRGDHTSGPERGHV